MNHRGTETQRDRMSAMAEDGTRDPITGQVIGLAIEVHRVLGPGLLESAHEECRCYELA
jgi:hypothetical protein